MVRRSLPVILTSLIGCLFVPQDTAAQGGPPAPPLPVPAQFEVGSVTLSQPTADDWLWVPFTRVFKAPPVVVMGPATKADGSPLTVTAVEVHATGFYLQLNEWEYLDGPHASESVHFMALTEGTHVFGTQRWQVGKLPALNRGVVSVPLTGFTATPVVLAQVNTYNNWTTSGDGLMAVKTRVNSVTSTAFQVNLETQQANTGTILDEGVSYIAVSQGTGYLDGRITRVVRTNGSTNYPHVSDAWTTLTYTSTHTSPLFIAQTQTKNDTDPGELRMQLLASNPSPVSTTTVQLQFQEETSAEADTTHTAEAVGFIILGSMGSELQAKVEVGDLLIQQSNAATWTKVNLAKTYTNPVVVMGPPSYTNSTPVTVRVRNALGNDSANGGKGSFEFQIDRWEHVSTQAHNALEKLSYFVMEQGTYAIGGGRWQAGRTTVAVNGDNTGKTQTGTAVTVPWMPNTPAVFSQVATTNTARACTSRVHTITTGGTGGFLVEVSQSEIDTAPHASETVHWIAMSQGTSNFFSSGMRIEAGNGTDIDSSFRNRPFTRMHADPFLFAAMQTKIDADPATLRWRYLFADKVELLCQEDAHPSANNTHSAETVAYFIVQGATDTDGDGAPDSWELANSLNPNNANDGSLDPDGDLLTNQQEYHNRLGVNGFLTSTNPLTFTGGIITASVAAHGYEVNDLTAATRVGTQARLRVNRIGGIAPVTVNLTLAGSPAASNRSSASAADYTAWTAASGGTAVTNSLALTVNSTSRDIYIRLTDDYIDEYREGLRLTITSGSQYTLGSPLTADALLYDALDTPVNEKLFVGRFLPQSGVATGASGFATLILNGSNTAARLSTTFNGLTTPQTDVDGSHVHYQNGGSGPVATGTVVHGEPDGLPNGPLFDHPWTIVNTAGLTGQQIIDALFRTGSDRLYVNVHTTRYAGGEIRADLARLSGSESPPAAPATPTLENLASDAEVRRDCARFLTQATFGPSEAEIDALFNSIAAPKTSAANRITAFSTWLNNQWNLPQTSLYEYHQAANNQEWALWGQQPLLDGSGVNVGNPPNNPSDWTKWSSTVGSPPIPAGRNKESYDPDEQNRRRGWWMIANHAKDQLRQRAAYALEQIFVVSDRDGTIQTRSFGHSRYYDLLADAADGIRHLQPPGAPTLAASYSSATGGDIRFKELLLDISRHPIMGRYLSSLQNRMATYDTSGNLITAPDENYAREIMQLFSIGLFQLWEDGSLRLAPSGQPIPTYFNDDIKELARVFTGWSFAYVQNSAANNYVPPLVQNSFLGSQGAEYFHPGYENPMKNFPFTGSGATRVDYHDPGAKVLQLRIDASGNRVADNLPAYTGNLDSVNDRRAHAEADMDAAVSVLFNHPNAAPFLSRLLIQRFVTSNPSRGYIYRVTQKFKNDGTGRRGNLRAVVNQILLDYEARSLANVDPQNINGNTSVNVSFGKVKEPLLRYIQLQRAFGAKSQLSVADLTAHGYPAAQLNNLDGLRTRLRFGNTNTDLAQTPNNMPSVFNWYLPDYSPGGRLSAAGLFAPELQIMTENLVVRSVNYHRTLGLSSIIDTTAAIPTGQGVGNLLGDTSTGTVLDNVVIDLSGIASWYRTQRGAAGPANNAAAEVAAATLLVDRLDTLLCGGALKAKYAYTADGADPRSVLIDQVSKLSPTGTNPPTIGTAGTRVRYAVYLLTSTPEYIVQK